MLYTGPLRGVRRQYRRVRSISPPPPHADDQSRIIHSVTQKEGSRIFDRRQADLPQNSWLARARSNLQVMYRTALAVSHTLDIDQLLQPHHGTDFRVGRGRPRLHHALRSGHASDSSPACGGPASSAERGDKITISKTILDYVIERNEGVLTSDARQDDRFRPGASIVKLGVREAICVPMQGRYHVVGRDLHRHFDFAPADPASRAAHPGGSPKTISS